MKIALINGLMEGRYTSRALGRCFENAGHSFVALDDADIIIAHSGGWLSIDQHESRKIILINPGCNNPPHWRKRFSDRARYDIRSRAYLDRRYPYERILNLFYLIVYFPRWMRMLTQYKTMDIHLFRKDHVVIIQTSDESWFDSSLSNSFLIMRIDGDHDDCWHNPEKYVSLVEKIYRM